jgi:hypothetical protein
VDFGAIAGLLTYKYQQDFADGTGDDQAKSRWTDQRTIAASGTDDLDLAGSLLDDYGNVITFTNVKVIMVRAADANTNDVVVGGAAANQFFTFLNAATDKIKIKPGGILVLVAPNTGYAVTAATGDILRIANGGAGTSVTYDIEIVGTT